MQEVCACGREGCLELRARAIAKVDGVAQVNRELFGVRLTCCCRMGQRCRGDFSIQRFHALEYSRFQQSREFTFSELNLGSE